MSSSRAREVLETLGLTSVGGIVELWTNPPEALRDLLYLPSVDAATIESALEDARSEMLSSGWEVPSNLLPIVPIDERSFAAVVCQPVDEAPLPGVGMVLRFHLDNIPEEHQLALVDIDLTDYVNSVIEELDSRGEGWRKVAVAAKEYQREYVEKGRRPKNFVRRPIQLACQNVVIGLAVVAHDSSFDGLRVPLWQTCEVPHVATHEGNRALTALMLCDAYQSGGTMEIRFTGHPEKKVPASLRRYARTQGIELQDDAIALLPEHSRALFLAVTPMPESLRERVDDYVSRGVESAERLCYTLMAQVWREIELEWLLATSARAPAILAGGSDPELRPVRMAEAEVCRAALLLGMLFRRLDVVDAAGAEGEVRAFEDTSAGVKWQIMADDAACLFQDCPDGPLPWQRPGVTDSSDAGRFVAVPRAHPTASDVDLVLHLAERTGLPTALVVPADRNDLVDCPAPVLVCPDRLGELDAQIERSLLTSRVARA